MAGRPWVFPSPNDYPPASPPLICDRTRVLALFNQLSGEKAHRITDRVEEWFIHEAFDRGWSAAAFVVDAGTNHSGGCILMSEHALAYSRNTGRPTIHRIGH